MTLQFNRYVLKKPVISDTRLQKIAKTILDECFEDRKRALEVYKMFMANLQTGNIPANIDPVKGVIDSLKLAQSTFGSVLKLVDVMVKLNIVMSKGSKEPDDKGKHKDLYSSLESLRADFENDES